jgi:polyisoprenyl-phosphate glycosyltransferase
MIERPEDSIAQLPGPILITGAAGFVGSQILARFQSERMDVFGTTRSATSWRISAFQLRNMIETPSEPLLLDALERVQPKLILHLSANGAYSFQQDRDGIVQGNLNDLFVLTDWAEKNDASIIHAGTSSEYGWNSAGPAENSLTQPNSLYAITKLAASNWLQYRSRVAGLKSCVLRLYSVYGPGEDSSRLVPALIREGLRQKLPPFAASDVSRDYVYVEDVVDAFIKAGLLVSGQAYGKTYNIASGRRVAMSEVAEVAVKEFELQDSPNFGAVSRSWDLTEWFGNPSLAQAELGWCAETTFPEGLAKTRAWYTAVDHLKYLDPQEIPESTRGTAEIVPAISAVIACYRDAQAIPYMYERLCNTFEALDIGFEIIFVNDCSPDDSLAVIEEISRRDPRVVGVTHARNFGSQAAFLSGMRIATGDNVVLLDGDLQDPPELISEFWSRRQEGFDVVYGRRVDRDAPWFMRQAYKAFYRVFQYLAPFSIPRDAGDFSLMSRRVVEEISHMPERDLFIRAQRAYVGFPQVGVDYKRPERMFGRSTNSLGRNFGWATKGVLAVSRAPLTALSIFALSMFGVSSLLIVAQILTKIFIPSIAPQGLVSLSVIVLGLGSLNLLAIAIVGEYVGRILEETKRRPRFVRRLVTRSGQTMTEERQES